MDSFAEQINSYNPQYVIDAGCGQNIWKGKVQNPVGFDWTEYPTMITLVITKYLMNIQNLAQQTLYFV